MNKLKLVNSKKYRLEDKAVCKLWLSPSCLTAEQIRNTIDDFAAAVTFNLDLKTDDDYIASDIAILTEDILEMDSISEEEKDRKILRLIQDYPEDQVILRLLARRVIKQINIDVKNYKDQAIARGYCKKLINRL